MSKEHLLILGAGPGGYSAAFYAADHGYKVTLVDENNKPGGVCLHRGCIPSDRRSPPVRDCASRP